MPAFTKEQIKEISGELSIGLRAFYHKETGELIFVPDPLRGVEIELDIWQKELDKLEETFMYYQRIESMNTHESFEVMTDFTEQVSDKRLQKKLINALDKKKPFREFKFIIDNAGSYREQWFAFRDKRHIEWVEEQIAMHNMTK